MNIQLCRICLRSHDIIISSSYAVIFNSLMGDRTHFQELEELWLCRWCKLTLSKIIKLKKLADKSQKILSSHQKVKRDFSGLYEFSHYHNNHIDIPPNENTKNDNKDNHEDSHLYSVKNNCEEDLTQADNIAPYNDPDINLQQDFRDRRNSTKEVRDRIKKYICHMCGKAFRSKQHLTVHLRSHTGEKPYKCSECTRYFATKSNLRTHAYVHTKIKQFYCVECDAHYKTQKGLNRHLAESFRHAAKENFQYSCVNCPKKFVSEKSLNTHTYKHLTVYRCGDCHKVFSNNSNLNKHIRCFHHQ